MIHRWPRRKKRTTCSCIRSTLKSECLPLKACTGFHLYPVKMQAPSAICDPVDVVTKVRKLQVGALN